MADQTFSCPYCPRELDDANGLYSHVKAKHGKRKAYPLRPASEREPSMAELHVALMARLPEAEFVAFCETL